MKDEKKKSDSRVRILDAAAGLFRRKGFTATGVDELMSEAGLTAGAFYAHFSSKQELFDHTLEHILAGSAKQLTRHVGLVAGKKVVVEMMARYVSEAHRDNPGCGCAIPAIASEIERHSKNGKKTVGKYVARWVAFFEKNLEGAPKRRRAEALRLVSQAVGSVLIARMVSKTFSKEILSAAEKIP